MPWWQGTNLPVSSSLNDEVKEVELGTACRTNVDYRNAYRIFLGMPEEERPLERCVDNIKMYLREIGRGGSDWIDVAQDGDQ
jgi:hypothetical protein